MRKTQLILKFAALAVVIAFGFGMLRLWMLRFESGDIYRPYSSLRTDPKGTRAFYESLEQLPGVTVRRNYKSLKKLTNHDGNTLFYLGIDSMGMSIDFVIGMSGPPDLGGDSAQAIHDFAASGGRVVVSFAPSVRTSGLDVSEMLFGDRDDENEDDEESTDDEEEEKERDEEEDEEEKDKTEDPDEEDDAHKSPGSILGLSLGGEDDDSWRQLRDTPAKGADEISSDWPAVKWLGRVYFKELSDDWKVIYRRGDKPVIIEKTIGAGSIVICADTYFLSNEAMIDPTARNPQLLAWLASKPAIIFDETHLGVVSSEGIASLARDHGLAHLFFVLLVIAGLYIWKSSVSFLPRDPEHTERFGGREISGRSSAAGLHNLLRKCIPVSGVLTECLKHWSASASTSRREQRDAQDKIRAVIAAENSRPARRQDPVKAYTTICRILAERKK